MVGYFGTFAVTMMISADVFWGPSSVMPYGAELLDEAAFFFARLVGLMFGIVVAGFLYFGTPRKTFIKQTMSFHLAGSVFMINNALSTGAFTPWVWQAQMLLGAGLAGWGFATLNNDKSE